MWPGAVLCIACTVPAIIEKVTAAEPSGDDTAIAVA
jgi:hypothetical protein